MTREQRQKVEAHVAWIGLLAGIAVALILVAHSWIPSIPWHQPDAAFWSVAGGFAIFYGVGCFRVWPGDDPTSPVSRTWLAHQYWLNGVGSLVGWVALYFLLQKYVHGESIGEGAKDFALGLVAFLGITGHLPLTAVGIAVAIRDVAKKALAAVAGGK